MFIWEYDNLIHIKKIEIIFKNKFIIKQIMKDEIEKKKTKMNEKKREGNTKKIKIKVISFTIYIP